MDNQKETFEDFCRMKFIDCDSKESKAITKAKGEKVIRLLKNQGDLTDCTPKFRYWVKSKKFQLISHSALGLKDVLCLLAKAEVSHCMTVCSSLDKYPSSSILDKLTV